MPHNDDEVINIMLDLETLGTRPGCKILSIGATVFDTSSYRVLALTFYLRADPNLQHKLHTYTAAEDWWAKQDPEVRAEAFGGSLMLLECLRGFVTWIENLKAEIGSNKIRIWCKGATFDVPIIEYAMEVYGVQVPWKYYEVACFRTLQDLGLSLGIDADKLDGDKHNALHDAINQAAHAEKILETLRAQVR